MESTIKVEMASGRQQDIQEWFHIQLEETVHKGNPMLITEISTEYTNLNIVRKRSIGFSTEINHMFNIIFDSRMM
jgi:hypothetical protein